MDLQGSGLGGAEFAWIALRLWQSPGIAPRLNLLPLAAVAVLVVAPPAYPQAFCDRCIVATSHGTEVLHHRAGAAPGSLTLRTLATYRHPGVDVHEKWQAVATTVVEGPGGSRTVTSVMPLDHLYAGDTVDHRARVGPRAAARLQGPGRHRVRLRVTTQVAMRPVPRAGQQASSRLVVWGRKASSRNRWPIVVPTPPPPPQQWTNPRHDGRWGEDAIEATWTSDNPPRPYVSSVRTGLGEWHMTPQITWANGRVYPWSGWIQPDGSFRLERGPDDTVMCPGAFHELAVGTVPAPTATGFSPGTATAWWLWANVGDDCRSGSGSGTFPAG